MPWEPLNNEKELLTLVSQGDEGAFRALFRFYQPRLFTAACRMLGDNDLAKDIYQDIFLKVWLKRTELPEIENFNGWLFTVSKNLMYDAINRSSKNKLAFLDILRDGPQDRTNDPDRLLERKEVQEVLKKAVARLPAKQKQTYTMIRIQGLSRLEVAKKMNISPETVKSNLQFALRSIRAYCIKNLDFQIVLILTINFLR